MAAVPALVVLRAHKPCPTGDMIAAAAALPPRTTPSDITPLFIPPLSAAIVGTGAAGSFSSPISPGISRTASTAHILTGVASSSTTTNTATPSTTAGAAATKSASLSSPPSSSSSTATSTIQTRTLHPQVHYIFENDPLETEILESIPKSRCITLDLDPRSGSIKNVESFLMDLQVMDVKLVPFQAALATTTISTTTIATTSTTTASSSSSSLNSPNTTLTTNNNNNNNNALIQQLTKNDGQSNPTPLGRPGHHRTDSSGASSLQSSSIVTNPISTPGTGPGTVLGAKDWTLVIEAVEVDERDQDSDSELLDQSTVSSLDTDIMPDDYLSHCDALLKSFSARNFLIHKVIDYAATTSSSVTASPH
ncbi:hypothetical protein BC939DRAFT_461019 [Gamsiella multidivaricata]|uniref:uncharacterized protein n=1 Tax=Gamsiella multidivaricata TaxID=101098 RepID=UPI00221E3D78|nr:uncharacterized protein BC939DRAFT_461019 [Gamsiella multidivaricata]KAI7819184.1 hypothetical protein BC939DRAFT_461019 [Gamsiella multidivaricata]